MRKVILRSAIVLLLLVCVSFVVMAKTLVGLKRDKSPAIKELKDGWYSQQSPQYASYLVDTKAQLCFARTSEGFTLIPSENLENRPEWREIITW